MLLRQYPLCEEIGAAFPEARKFLWLHNMPSRKLYHYHAALSKYRFEVIAVSHFHQQAIIKRLRGKSLQRIFTSFKNLLAPNAREISEERKHYPLSRVSSAYAQLIPVHVLYNPIDSLMPDHTRWNPNQLIFTSSPQKGLVTTLKIFEQLRYYFSEYYLLIANPGYSNLNIKLPANAQLLGILPHHKVIQHLRESFCVFYPQQIKVETFGLVYAEANAVGTPVLAHHWGAAAEVLSDPGQLINGKNFNEVLEKIEQWRDKRPAVRGKDEFLLKSVIVNWLKLLSPQQ